MGSKGGRPATGSVKWRRNPKTGKTHWHVRLTMADGGRPFFPLDPSIPREDKARAKACGKLVADEARATGQAAAWVKETVAEYAERWCKWRATSDLGCVPSDRTNLDRHILPIIGSLDVRGIGRDDLKRLVLHLDAKAKRGFYEVDGRRWSFSFKTAGNAWSVVRSMFRDACQAKDPALCVRDDNPAHNVAPPEEGTTKAKVYLWPSEFSQLVGCPLVPLRWRRLFALAVYLYARAGELAALRWVDVDLEHGSIHIHRSVDRVRKRKTGSTKSDRARRIPIEPELVPLLRALLAESDATGVMFAMPSVGVLSHKLKVYLRRAGVTREELFVTDETRKAITFHDLRATGITWAIVRGDETTKVQQRAGHDEYETTQIYLREAENLSESFGEVFPRLPEDLLGSGSIGSVSDSASLAEAIGAESLGFPVELTGIEPTFAYIS